MHFGFPENVDHCVCVDGHRGLVWDSEERYVVGLNENSLIMCVGYNSRKVRLYVREMIKQRGKKD